MGCIEICKEIKVVQIRIKRCFKFFFLLLLLEINFSSSVFAQQKGNPFENVENFQMDLMTFMQKNPNFSKEKKQQIAQEVSTYIAYYSTLNLEDQTTILQISKKALQNNLTIFPDLFRFYLTYQKVGDSIPSSLDSWVEALDSLLETHKIKEFNALVDNSLQLISERVLNKSTSATWTVSNLDLVFAKLPEPNFVFSSIRLICKAYADSSCIYNTKGTYYPLKKVFLGSGGRVHWSRSGLDKDSCYAILSNYQLSLNLAKYTADSVSLFHSTLFRQPLFGFFSDKLSASSNLSESIYPQFISYNDDLYITDVFPNIDIKGPYQQQGKRTFFGKADQMATLFIRKDHTYLGRIVSNNLILKEDKITTPFAQFFMYLDQDSLYNNACEIRYSNTDRSFQIGYSPRFNVDMPFMDTYHGLRMNFETMIWYLDRQLAEIGMFKMVDRKGIATFKSVDLFSTQEMGEIMQGMDRNPLFLLKQQSQREGSRQLNISDIALNFGISETSIKSLLLNMASIGLLTYNPDENKVNLLPKLFHDLAVSTGNVDFDVLEFISGSEDLIKAHLYLDSLNLQVIGVDKVFLSRKQNVYIKPQGTLVNILKNRDFKFDGFLHGGTFDFYVKDAKFQYKDFKIEIGTVDTLSFSVRAKDANDNKKDYQVSTLLKSLSGVLYIDSSLNKGGIQNFPAYPIFESTIPSYVYYNGKDIQDGVYTTDSFYFLVDPFRIEQLNTFVTDSIRFAGTLFSAGIFPNIKDALVVMPDFSLGFTKTSPLEGWPAYGMQTRFFHKLRLDKQGLVGSGQLDYLNSTTKSKRMIFQPHNMYAIADSFRMENYVGSSISYPTIEGVNTKVEFNPLCSIYTLSTIKDSAVYVFDEKWKFNGTYLFSPVLSKAKGLLSKGKEAQLFSPSFDWSSRWFTSDTTTVKIFTVDGKNNLFYSTGYYAEIQLDDQEAKMDAYTQRSPVLFPLNAYFTKVSSLKWNFRDKTINMKHGSPISLEETTVLDNLPLASLFTANIPGEKYISIRKDQDSLNFTTQHSLFNYADTLLTVENVYKILVADALLVPFAKEVTIGPNAKIKPLKEALLLFDKENPVYSFYRVSADILSAKDYKASGFYNYKAPMLSNQPIYFSNISPDLYGHSMAQTYIPIDSNPLNLSNAFEYVGKININAAHPFAFFDGTLRMKYRCENIEEEPTVEPTFMDTAVNIFSTGIRFKSYLNPDSIAIPIDPSTRNWSGRTLGCGFYTQAHSGNPQFVFLQPIRSTDMPIISAEGSLQFSMENKAYKIVDTNNMEALSLQLSHCFATATDFIKLNLRTEEFRSEFYGNLSKNTEEEKFLLQTVAAFDFYFSKELFKEMASVLNKNINLTGADLANRPLFKSYVYKKNSEKESQRIECDINTYGSYTKIPDALRHSLLFSNLFLEWKEEEQAYVSKGQAELVSVDESPIGKQMKVYLKITRTRRGDQVDIYIEASRFSWFYISYSDHFLQIISSDMAFNNMLSQVKIGKRKRAKYEFSLSTLRKRNNFVYSMEQGSNFEDEAESQERQEEE
ncbi:MAG: hypothetical protein RRX93_01980 [Bacteroidales bacterium]